jgi:multidrug efflux pump subunit AcrB
LEHLASFAPQGSTSTGPHDQAPPGSPTQAASTAASTPASTATPFTGLAKTVIEQKLKPTLQSTELEFKTAVDDRLKKEQAVNSAEIARQLESRLQTAAVSAVQDVNRELDLSIQEERRFAADKIAQINQKLEWNLKKAAAFSGMQMESFSGLQLEAEGRSNSTIQSALLFKIVLLKRDDSKLLSTLHDDSVSNHMLTTMYLHIVHLTFEDQF